MNHFPHIMHAAVSDMGRKRTNNEDSYGEFPDAGFFCVADGMGGGDDGEVASAATIEAIKSFTEANPLPEKTTYVLSQYLDGLCRAVDDASTWIEYRTREKGLKGCGSTLVGFALDASNPGQATAIHAGDSRLYRLRGKNIKQITRDHSAAELFGAKKEADVNPMFRGMILRAVGVAPHVDIERTPFDVKAGDRLIVCSDGLSRMVADKQIAEIARAAADVKTAAQALIDAANEAGGLDNVTAVVVEIGTLPKALAAVPMQNSKDAGAHEGVTMDGATRETFDQSVTSGSWSQTRTSGISSSQGSNQSVAPDFASRDNPSETDSTGAMARTPLAKRIGLAAVAALAGFALGAAAIMMRESGKRPKEDPEAIGLRAKVESLEKDVKDRDELVATLKKARDEAKAGRAALEEKVAALSGAPASDGLKEKNEQLAREVARLGGACATLENEKQALEAEKAALAATNKSYGETIARLKAGLDSAKAAAGDAGAAMEKAGRAESLNAELQERIARANVLVEELKKKLSGSEAARRALEKERDAAKAAVEELRIKLENAEKGADAAVGKARELEKRLADEMAKTAAMERNIAAEEEAFEALADACDVRSIGNFVAMVKEVEKAMKDLKESCIGKDFYSTSRDVRGSNEKNPNYKPKSAAQRRAAAVRLTRNLQAIASAMDVQARKGLEICAIQPFEERDRAEISRLLGEFTKIAANIGASAPEKAAAQKAGADMILRTPACLKRLPELLTEW